MNDIKLLLSSVLIILAFFVGYFFWVELSKEKSETTENEKKYINIEVKRWKLDINNPHKDVILLINGQENTEEIELK